MQLIINNVIVFCVLSKANDFFDKITTQICPFDISLCKVSE